MYDTRVLEEIAAIEASTTSASGIASLTVIEIKIAESFIYIVSAYNLLKRRILIAVPPRLPRKHL